MIHPLRLGEVGFVVRDLERSLRWYRDHLGFEPLFEAENGMVVGRPDCAVWLAQARDAAATPAPDTSRAICPRLASFEVAREDLGRIEQEFPEDGSIATMDHPRYESRIVEDPDGHAIEFYAWKEAPCEPEQVQRIVVLLDVAGFAQLARGRDEGEVFRMLDRFYRAAETLAEAAGGTSWKYLGDAVLFAFATDRAGEAVRFAESVASALGSVWDCFRARCEVHVKADIVTLAWGRLGGLGQIDGIGHGLNQLFLHLSGGRDVSPALWELARSQAESPSTEPKSKEHGQ